MERLAGLEKRHKAQLGFNFDDGPQNGGALNASQNRRKSQRQAKEDKIDRLFQDWSEWFDKTRNVIDDPNPHVDVKAVFVG
jgi:CHAD domain-containing protein